MDKYLNQGIKDVIQAFPALESILAEYDIGCGPCNVGTCLLKDIVEIHRLPPEKEQALMARIESTICPGRENQVQSPAPTTAAPAAPKERIRTYSPPMKMLVDEHLLIKRWLARIPDVVNALSAGPEKGRQLVGAGVDMIRSYADKFHHGKEEDILFKYFDDTSEIFTVIYEDHRQARQHVQAILTGLETSDHPAIGEYLTAYGALLTEHIKKEDEILFPWLDEQLTTSQVGELYTKFKAADSQSGVDPEKYQTFVDGLESQFIDMGVAK